MRVGEGGLAVGLVRGRVGVDGRSLGDAPIPGVRSRSGISSSPATDGDASTRVDSPVEDWATGDDAFNDWADESYVDDTDTWGESTPVDDTLGEPPADDNSFHVDGEPSETTPTLGDANGGTAADAASSTGDEAVSAPENASDEPVAGERAPFGTWVRSVASRAAMGRLGVFFNPVARFRELSEKDAGARSTVSGERGSDTSRAASPVDEQPLVDDNSVGDDDRDVDELNGEGDGLEIGDDGLDADGDDSDALDDDGEGALSDDGDAPDDEGASSRPAASRNKGGSGRRSGSLPRAVGAVVALCRRILGVVLWPLRFVSRFVSRLVARPLSFVVSLLSRIPVVGRVFRLVSSAPRRARRLLRTLVWAALLCGVLFVFGWRPPFVPVSSGVAGVDLPDSGHLSVSVWRVDDELVNVHVVNDGETVVEGESVEVRASAWVPLSRLPWSLVTRTDGGSCLVDIDVVDVEDAADFVASCPAVGGIGESVVPVGSSFGE